MTVVLIVVIVLVVALVLWAVLARNSMIGSRNRVEESWSGIDVQLKRRHDLVPNLVETVKGYAQHEQQVLERTAEARAEAMRASGAPASDRQEAESKLSGALTELRAVAENYPQLRATENFQRLQTELAQIEDEIQASRRIYNSNVQSFNTRIQIFPNSVIASWSGFQPRDYFEIDTAVEREPVAVSFGSS